MKHENLSIKMQKRLESLKGASSTIENDILDAMEDAESEQEFISEATERLECLKDECQSWIQNLKADPMKKGFPNLGEFKNWLGETFHELDDHSVKKICEEVGLMLEYLR